MIVEILITLYFQQYSLRETDPSKACSFRLPKLSEIEQHRIIVTTLGTTSYLLRAGVRKGKAIELNSIPH